jgi:hypothetical protein
MWSLDNYQRHKWRDDIARVDMQIRGIEWADAAQTLKLRDVK